MISLLTNYVWTNIILSVIVFLCCLLLRKWFTSYIFKLILTYIQKKKIDVATTILLAFEKPVRWSFVVVGIQLALLFLPYNLISSEWENKFIRSSFIFLTTWGVFNISNITSLLFPKLMHKLDINFDRIIVPFVTKLIKTLVLMLGFSIIAEEWGFNINGFITGLGLGGLAFALAAKETVSNLFGGIVIITEKPFTMNDWIKTPSVEGTVEDITFRSTKIRTFAQALVTVPNATLANEPIINWSKMGKRQVSFYLTINLETKKESIQQVISEIKKLLHAHSDIHQETILVNFERFSENSFDIYIYYFTKITAFADYLNTKEDINYRIIDILDKADVAFSLPRSKVYMLENNDSLGTKREKKLYSHG